MKIWIVAQDGFDFSNMEILYLCSTEEIAKRCLAEYNATHAKPFPWNERDYVEVNLDEPFKYRREG